MADPKFDPIVQAEKAQELRALATRARDALRTDTVERTSRLGSQRDDIARQVYAGEQEIAAADQQVKRELAVAEKFEKAAATLERKASELERNVKGSITAEGEAEDLREQAVEQRALATAARQRVRAAEDAVDRIEDELHEKRLEVERLEKQLAAEPARRAEIELEVDKLEWHAREAEGFARNVEVVAEEEAEAAAAERNGDMVAAAAARARATELRAAIEAMGDLRATTTLVAPDTEKLQMIGITLPTTFLDTPGFPPASTTPPTTESEPTSQADDAGAVDDTPAPDEDLLTAGVETAVAGDAGEVDSLPDDGDFTVGAPAVDREAVVVGETGETGALPGEDILGDAEPAVEGEAVIIGGTNETDAVPSDPDFSVVEPVVDGEAVDDVVIDDVSIDASIEPATPEFTSVSDESDAVLAHFFQPEPEPDLTPDGAFQTDEPADFLDS